MKTILLICSFIICANVYSQSILSDKKDDATKTRKITTGTNPLYKNLTKTILVQSQLNIQDNSIISYELNFTAPDLPEANNAGSSPNTCLLKDESGTVISGQLNNGSSGFSPTNLQQSYTCKFSKEDFIKIAALKIIEIKISAAAGKDELFSIDKKLQDIISKQARIMLARLKINP